jgi:hypothetical protein
LSIRDRRKKVFPPDRWDYTSDKPDGLPVFPCPFEFAARELIFLIQNKLAKPCARDSLRVLLTNLCQ